MLFEARLQRGLADGSIRLAFRRWRRAQVVGGRQYRSPIGLIAVDAVAIVRATDITRADAQAAGYGSAAELLADLRGPPEGQLFRVALHPLAEADPRAALAADAAISTDDRQRLHARLASLDRVRPWTTATLEAIDQHPGTRAPDLAASLGWHDVAAFKANVRKLKALGLTLSLLVGYRLSPRGEAFLHANSSPNSSQSETPD